MERPLNEADAPTGPTAGPAAPERPPADRVADGATAEPRWRLPTDPPPA